MDFKEIKNKNAEGLHAMFQETKANLGKLRFDLGAKSLKNVSQIGKAKKEVARILTALKQLESSIPNS